jgi:inorganic triphosphatase YgiF
MTIKIQLEVIKGDAELKLDAEKISVADLQAAICNLELVKMNLIGQLAAMTDVHKGGLN